MSKFTVEIKTDNDAFHTDDAFAELARILRDLADNLEFNRVDGATLRDVNGNVVGSATFT